MKEPTIKAKPNSSAAHGPLAALPPVNTIIELGDLLHAAAGAGGGHEDAVNAAREALTLARARILSEQGCSIATDDIASEACTLLAAALRPTIRPALNATGIVLHTGLGRACLCAEAVSAVELAAGGPVQLEISAETGQRGSRQLAVSRLLCRLTGAESAAAGNNGAGAILLAIAALAAGKEVIISRGELVEIGGAFRMPEILAAGGATLVEVGATNRTRIADYRNAITERTGMILRCHQSNFAMIGFTESASSEELVALGREIGVPVVEDQGSGSILDPTRLGLSASHGSLPQSVAAGFDIVTASGDKLLGGPQAGLILGRTVFVNRMMSHPLARALRADKLGLAALEATLRVYSRGADAAIAAIPVLHQICRNLEDIQGCATQAATFIAEGLAPIGIEVGVVQDQSQPGGGSIPGDNLPTWCISLDGRKANISADEVARRLRMGEPGVFGRIRNGLVLLDLRCIQEGQLPALKAAVVAACLQHF